MPRGRDGIGADDIIAAQGNKGVRVKTYSGASDTILNDFKVGPGKYKGGLWVTTGDIDGDGKADIITGRNKGRPSSIEVFSGLDAQPIGSAILPFGSKYKSGIRVAAMDINFDGIADIMAGAGFKGGSKVAVFDEPRDLRPSTSLLSLTTRRSPSLSRAPRQRRCSAPRVPSRSDS